MRDVRDVREVWRCEVGVVDSLTVAEDELSRAGPDCLHYWAVGRSAEQAAPNTTGPGPGYCSVLTLPPGAGALTSQQSFYNEDN